MSAPSSDAWRREVLAQHWPGVPIYEDVYEAWDPGFGMRLLLVSLPAPGATGLQREALRKPACGPPRTYLSGRHGETPAAPYRWACFSLLLAAVRGATRTAAPYAATSNSSRAL